MKDELWAALRHIDGDRRSAWELFSFECSSVAINFISESPIAPAMYDKLVSKANCSNTAHTAMPA